MTDNSPDRGGIFENDQLARNYDDSLILEYTGCEMLIQAPLMEYRNNLAVFSDTYGIYLVASTHHICIFQWDAVKNLPRSKPIIKIITKPSATTLAHHTGANWPARPHYINFIKLVKLGDEEHLVIACDDGRILGYKVDKFYSLSLAELPDNIIASPSDFCIQLQSSAWGIDADNEKQLLAVTDNTKQVTLVRLSDFKQWVSPEMGHNVPDVQFLNPGDHYEHDATSFIACIGIDNELVIWWFDMALDGEDEDCCVEVLDQDIDAWGWTVTELEEKDFKQVSSLIDALGDPYVDEPATFEYFKRENNKLGLQHDSYYPSSRFSYTPIRTAELRAARTDMTAAIGDNRQRRPPLTCVTERDSKRRKYLGLTAEVLLNPPFKNSFLFCTTQTGVILSRTEDFTVNAATPDVFSWSIFENAPKDRLNLVVKMADISALAVATQAGVISIFRMVRYQGVFSIRQEYLFPQTEMTLYRLTKAIIGLTARKVNNNKYQLLVLFEDDVVYSYMLTAPPTNNSTTIIDIEL